MRPLLNAISVTIVTIHLMDAIWKIAHLWTWRGADQDINEVYLTSSP